MTKHTKRLGHLFGRIFVANLIDKLDRVSRPDGHIGPCRKQPRQSGQHVFRSLDRHSIVVRRNIVYFLNSFSNINILQFCLNQLF